MLSTSFSPRTTTITIYTGNSWSFRASPGDELKIVLQQNLEAPEDLSYAKTTEGTYHREVPAGVSVGCKDWTMSCISNLPVEQALIRLQEKFDNELQTVNKKLQALTEDSELWATRYLKNVAGETLLWACGDQPACQGPSHRFQDLAYDNDRKLATYACSLPLSPDPTRLGPVLDGVVNRRDCTVYFTDMQGLQQAVQDVVGLLARHPELRRRCQHEVMVIDSFADLKTAFNV